MNRSQLSVVGSLRRALASALLTVEGMFFGAEGFSDLGPLRTDLLNLCSLKTA